MNVLGSALSDELLDVYAEFAAPEGLSRKRSVPDALAGRRIAVQYVVPDVTVPDAEHVFHPVVGELMVHDVILDEGFDALSV